MNRSVLYYPIEVNKCIDKASKVCLDLIVDKATEIVCKDWLYPVIKYPVGNEFIDNDEFILGMFINALHRLESGDKV